MEDIEETKVFLRGLIEFSSYCKNDCLSRRVKFSGYEIVVDRGDFKPL